MSNIKVFISHNHKDKGIAREVATFLITEGVDVWFDEWEISAGDSIIGKVSGGLKDTTHFVLIWSARASKSNWVTTELEVALTKHIQNSDLTPIVIRLPRAPELPLMLQGKKYIKYDKKKNIEQRGSELVDEILGRKASKSRMQAVVQLRNEMIKVDEDSQDDYGYEDIRAWGFTACPDCGHNSFEYKQEVSYNPNGDGGIGERFIICLNCNWSQHDWEEL